MNIPKHIAIIMDGNGRWANKNSVSTKEGHKNGAEAAKLIIEDAAKKGVKFLTLYAFSSENWKRSAQEVEAIKDLLEYYLDNEAEELIRKGVKLNFIGDYDAFGEKISQRCEYLINISKDNNLISANIALNYGARQEIERALKLINENKEEISQENISKNLYGNNFPDPDLLIRTGGEKRISNFLLWQISYSELYFSDVLWPDFKKDEFEKALEEYNSRHRRFGAR